METDEPVFEGFLTIPPSGKILKKAWQKKYCFLHERSSCGISRIEMYENKLKTSQAKIITLEDVIKITPKSSNVIHIVTKNSEMEFGTMSGENLNNWFEALKKVVFSDESTITNAIEQDNELYCSADEGVFCVKLHPSEASQRCNLESKNYILVITSSVLQLRNEGDNKLLFKWPFSYIRKYGYKNKKFTFEAGRKCSTGEGVFYFEHPNHNDIYRCVSSKIKHMKKLFNGESLTSLIDCEDMQLHVALNMEAGSRHPLPLALPTSMSTQNSLEKQEFTKASVELLSSSSISSVESINIVKAGPKKPPRKSLPAKNIPQTSISVRNINASCEYADVDGNQFNTSKYDTVESRKGAWKTMGVQEPTLSWSTEKRYSPVVFPEPTSPPLMLYSKMQAKFGSSSTLNIDTSLNNIPQENKSIQDLSFTEDLLVNYEKECLTLPITKPVSKMRLIERSHAPTVISGPIQCTVGQSYDQLNFFGQSNGPTPKSDYKEVKSTAEPVKLYSNFYEEVDVRKSARSADDSHLGYASIKKDGSSAALKEVKHDLKTNLFEEVMEEGQRVTHQFQNHELYTVVSKPKRV